MEEFFETLRENLEREHYDFENGELTLETRALYNDWYIIAFYESYYEMLISDFLEGEENKELIKWLSKFENPLRALYDYWMDCDGALSLSWDDMKDWLEMICEDVKQNG